MKSFLYHRLVLAYHGCEKETAMRVLTKNDKLKPSEKDYDWLGSGIYFWEQGPDRALKWAKEKK